jgi:hypothetical protein
VLVCVCVFVYVCVCVCVCVVFGMRVKFSRSSCFCVTEPSLQGVLVPWAIEPSLQGIRVHHFNMDCELSP